MILAEHETHISYDYAQEEVLVYTTRKGVRNELLRRLEPVEDQVTVLDIENGERTVAWNITAPMEFFKTNPGSIANTANTIQRRLDKNEATKTADSSPGSLPGRGFIKDSE